MEDVVRALEKERDHLDKVIKSVSNNGNFLRPPYQRRPISVSENLKSISRNLDKLSEQVQQTTDQHS